MSTTDASVAIYWDFENIHASLYSVRTGQSYSSPENRYRQQDPIVNIQAVMDYAATLGDIVINRAYCHWQWFARYQEVLNECALDLVQHFPRGMKNGADIRLALDVIEDLHHYPHVSHVVIVGGDSDYISLSQKVRQSGRVIIGTGVRETTNHFWIKCCNEFKFYKTLLTRSSAVESEQGDEDPLDDKGFMEARALMLRSIRKIVATLGENRVPSQRLKQLMMRNDPSFDEANFGFASFTEFLEAFSDVVACTEEEAGVFVSITDESAAEAGAVVDYQAILRRSKIRPLPPAWWRRAVVEVERLFREAEDRRLASFDELERKLGERMEELGLPWDEERVHKLRGNLYALRQFRLMGADGIGLFAAENGKRPLLDCVDEEILRRLVRYAADPISVERAAFLLHGSTDAKEVERIRAMVDRLGDVDHAVA